MEANQSEKSRLKTILNCKKPAFWIVLAAILLGIAVAVCFLTLPKKHKREAEPEPTTTPVDDPEAVSVPGSEVKQWLDYYDASSELPWDQFRAITIDAFPNIRFLWTSGSVEAIDVLSSIGKSPTLFSGMPIWNVYFADVTGDGKPELCATVSFGSGVVDEHIVVYDYENRQSYTLWGRFKFDYHLYPAEGKLLVGKTPYTGDKQVDYGTLVMHDGVLCCQWQSDGSFTPLNRELHESELHGEWLVEQETDNDGNVLYTFPKDDLWKEYHFKPDGTVVYNETVPISSDYEKAFGHPATYPYEVHDNLVYIAGDDTSGAFRWGQYDPETRTLTLMYNTPDGTVYAKLRRMGEGTKGETALDEATLCTVWRLAEIEASDGSSGDARALGLEQYLVFRSDGTVRMIDAKAPSDRIVPYFMNGNTVQFDDRVLRYDPALNELLRIDPSTQDILSYTPAPNIDAQTIEEMLLGIHTCTSATAGGTEIAVPERYVGMQINLGDSYDLGYPTTISEYFHVASVTIGGEEKNGYDWSVDANNMLTVRNDQTGDTWAFQWLEKENKLLLTLAEKDASGNPIVLTFPID